MTQPTLDERFAKKQPRRRTQDRQGWMTSNERRFVLWGLKEGWSAARIGRSLGVNEATVRRFRTRFSQDPQLLLKLSLYEMVGRAKDDEYRCLVCGDQIIRRQAVERHILLHYLDESKVSPTLPADFEEQRATTWKDDTLKPREREAIQSAPSKSSLLPPIHPRAALRSPSSRGSASGMATGGENAPGSPGTPSGSQVKAGELTASTSTEDLVNKALSRIARQSEELKRLFEDRDASDTTEAPKSQHAPDLSHVAHDLPAVSDVVLDEPQKPPQMTSGPPQGPVDRPSESDKGLQEIESVVGEPVSTPETPVDLTDTETDTSEGHEASERLAEQTAQTGPSQHSEDVLSESDERRDEFELLRQMASESQEPLELPSESDKGLQEIESVVGEPVSTPETPVDLTDTETDTSEWHEAFERLAEQRAQTGPSQRSEDVSSESDNRLQEFELLRQQASESQGPVDRPSESDKGLQEIESVVGEPVSTPETPVDLTDTETDTSEGHEASERLAEQHPQPGPSPHSEAVSSGSDERRHEFELLRQMASESQDSVGRPSESDKGLQELEGIVGEPVSTPETPVDLTNMETDTSEWHEAFERLAEQRAQAGQAHEAGDAFSERAGISEGPDGPEKQAPGPGVKSPPASDAPSTEGDGDPLVSDRPELQAPGPGAIKSPPASDAPSTEGDGDPLVSDRPELQAPGPGAIKSLPDSDAASAEGDGDPLVSDRPEQQGPGPGAIQLPPISSAPLTEGDSDLQVSDQTVPPFQVVPSPADFDESEEAADDGLEKRANRFVTVESQRRIGARVIVRLWAGRIRPALRRVPTLLSMMVNIARKPAAKSGSLVTLAGRGRNALQSLAAGSRTEVTSIAVEHGAIKLLVTQGLDVIDYRIVPADRNLFREGLISDAPRMANLIQGALREMKGNDRHVIAAVPGYQTNLRRIELPNAKGMNPKFVIPREAQRTMGISPENSHLSWHRLPGTEEIAHWLVLAATNRSISSMSTTVESAGLRINSMELRPFALARAVNQADAVLAWTAADGCDVVVVREWVPITYQTAYWGAGLMVEADSLVNRVTEVVESTLIAHDRQNPEMSANEDIPLFVSGSPAAGENNIGQRVATNLRRKAARPEPALTLPPEFPVDDLIVNIGLALWQT